jgi:hypothetical protein
LLSLGAIIAPAAAQVVSPGMTAPQSGTQEQPQHPATGTSAGTSAEAESSERSEHMTSGSNASSGQAMLPQPQTEGDITYVCGGVGKEEATYMKKAAADYDLMLTFATRDGSYLADVDVQVRDAQNNPVLDTTCDGPLMLVDLPHSGKYSVRAEAQGTTLQQAVQVTKTTRRATPPDLVLSWPMKALQQQGDETMSGNGASPGTEKGTAERAQGERIK